MQQPLSLLPKSVSEYVENTKNEITRIERRLAYASLLSGLKAFYDIDDFDIKKTVDGKPYLVIKGKNEQYQKNEDFHSLDYKPYTTDGNGSIYQRGCSISDGNKTDEKILSEKSAARFGSAEGEESLVPCSASIEKNAATYETCCEALPTKIQISISHSGGVSAVCISDEGEVGVDIQIDTEKERAERLNERFFPDLKIKKGDIEVSFYYCHVDEKNAVLERFEPEDASEENPISKWAYSESQLKFFGGGFKDLKLLSESENQVETVLKKYCSESNFVLAVSARKQIKK